MAKTSRRFKVSVNLRPFISRVVRDGRVQRAFAEKLGKKVGACVAEKVKKGMSWAEVKNVVRECAKKYEGTKLFEK